VLSFTISIAAIVSSIFSFFIQVSVVITVSILAFAYWRQWHFKEDADDKETL
jgi:hypothetical protein